jgi:multisubunit Na+/H+ antiporter MnhB subunit
MIDALLALAVAFIACAVAFIVHLAREGSIRPRTVRALAAVCGVGLIAMLLSDWPLEFLSTFWAEHSILAAVLSSVLLIGLVFLVYEEREQRAQERLDDGLSSAGLGGLVDHLVDVEVALGCVCEGAPPSGPWSGWAAKDRPLRWLREERDRLYASDGRPSADDPRRHGATSEADGASWRLLLIDQCVRRLLSGMRDWTPLIGTSKNGVIALLAISELRKDLMELSALLERGRQESDDLLVSLRQRLRVLAYFFEERSGAQPHRPEVLRSMYPLPPLDAQFSWAADARTRDLFDKRWSRLLADSVMELQRG